MIIRLVTKPLQGWRQVLWVIALAGQQGLAGYIQESAFALRWRADQRAAYGLAYNFGGAAQRSSMPEARGALHNSA